MSTDINQIQEALDSFFSTHFDVTPEGNSGSNSQAKKRHSASIGLPNPEDLLVITPKDFNGQWKVEILQLAVQISQYIEQTAAVLRQECSVDQLRHEKLFPNSVIFEKTVELEYEHFERRMLPLAAQQYEFWTAKANVEQSIAVRGLLEQQQLTPLLYLAGRRETQIKQTAHLRNKRIHYYFDIDDGWAKIVEETLQPKLLIFMGILGSLPDELVNQGRYQRQLPLTSVSSRELYFALEELVEQQGTKVLRRKTEEHMTSSIRIMAMIHVMHQVCKLTLPNWRQIITNSILSFIGKDWSREEAWLLRHVDKEDRLKYLASIHIQSNIDEVKKSKQQDPLFLRDAKKEQLEPEEEEEEDDDSYQEHLEKLAQLEVEETAYGRKRSSKYQRKVCE